MREIQSPKDVKSEYIGAPWIHPRKKRGESADIVKMYSLWGEWKRREERPRIGGGVQDFARGKVEGKGGWG